ncbi:MAG: hypothetical protein KME49_22630 [Brasilonema octagenarum HA4186-MV1]|jgi:MoxR-like ATPase|nr:hypothetical protein [Brasilonema octagenarum HA4186-MV1]
MHNSNGKSTNLLQQAVTPLDDTQRSRVLEFALKCHIDPNDPFWVQYIILGELQVSDWRSLLVEFKDELQLLAETNEQWSDTNLELMDSLVRKAQLEETLSTSLGSLLSALSNLTTSSTVLTQQLKESAEKSAHLSSVQATSLKELTQQVNELKLLSDRQTGTLQKLSLKLEGSSYRIRWEWVGLAGAVVVFAHWSAWNVLSDTNQRVKWTLQKVHCATSIKASKTIHCKSIFR